MKIIAFILIVCCSVCIFNAPERVQAQDDGAMDCFLDPVYERNFNARPNIALYLRDVACVSGSKILTTLSPEKVYQVIAETDGWYKIKLADGTIGWAGSSLMTKTTLAVNDSAGKTDSSMAQKLSGMILLQVQENGEAWYVYPVNYYRYYLGRPADAFTIMRGLGLGIKHAELNNYLKNGFPARLAGKIMLDVENNGEAYYIYPKNLTGYYLGRPADAFAVMRGKGLGITNQDLLKIPVKAWLTTSESITADSSSRVINLSASSANNTVKLVWSIDGFDSPKGFKIVKSDQPNPVYPGDEYHYLADPNIRIDSWSGLTAGRIYHFRVCEYLGGACGAYSNDVQIQVSGATGEVDGNIDLTASVNSEGKVILTWSLTNMTSALGFKVVVSETSDPVYPGNEYHYLSNPDIRTDTWSNLAAGQTYYFRVCEYLGGKCGIYSNNAMIEL